MNLQSLFKDFNLSKFVVYSCLLVFSILFALRLDGTINISYWTVFIPLWIWKGLVITGAMVGTVVWARNPDYRLSETSYIAFKSMLISLSLQLLLLMFELLVCDKLESDRHLWTLAFIPLLFVSLLSVAITVWSLKNDRAFELELFCAVNVLQFLFIALRLDNLLGWSWVVVFVPFWVIITLAVIGVLYALIFAAILLRTPEVAVDQRRESFQSAVSYSLIVLPLLIFLVLLSNKLDYNQHQGMGHIPHLPVPFPPASLGHHGVHGPPMSPPLITPTSNPSMSAREIMMNGYTSNAPAIGSNMSYFSVCFPLYLTFVILILLSFTGKGGNMWWFGMRRDFCSFLLTLCPCLREYGNISYTKTAAPDNNNMRQHRRDSSSQGESGHSPVVGREGVDDINLDTNRFSSSSPFARHFTIIDQPKKSSPLQFPPHITIESPD